MLITLILGGAVLAGYLWFRFRKMMNRVWATRTFALMIVASRKEGLSHEEICRRISYLLKLDEVETSQTFCDLEAGDPSGWQTLLFLLVQFWVANRNITLAQRSVVMQAGRELQAEMKWAEFMVARRVNPKDYVPQKAPRFYQPFLAAVVQSI